MLVVFGDGKCPLCGNFGKEIRKKTFHCQKCELEFNDFLISNFNPEKKFEYKYWT